jgi:short-subunit dehydrogenase
LITGGTSGIGAAYARNFAARGYDLVLVARDAARLRETATELTSTFGIEVETISADLAVRADVDHVAARLETGARPIDVFINNAGFGMRSRLVDADTSEHERAIDVMIKAVLLLGGAAGRGMTVRGHGRIANTGSMSAWISQGNYSAIKAWVTAYSEALGVQLAGTGVTVTNISPGWVRTEFHDRAGIRNSIPSWVWVDADTMARLSIDDILKGKAQSVPTVKWKLATFFVRHAPRSVIRLISRTLLRSRE